MAQPRTATKFSTPKRKRVALLVETSNSYARGVLEGITSYAREHHAWSVYLPEQRRGGAPPRWLSHWKGDGIIARIETPQIARLVAKTRLPVVDLSAARLVPHAPWVETDDYAIAALAADHLQQRGFKHFAYCGDGRFNWSKWRGEFFTGLLKSRGYECHVYQPPRAITADDPWNKEEAEIARWLLSLPKPLGVMACYDIRGKQVADACRRAGLSVPDEVAVLGVDDDNLLCALAEPPLSSIAPNTHKTGYTAAALLDRMMSGTRVPADAHLIEPLGIITRQSTDVLAIEDRDVSEAIRLIREHACRGIRVSDLLKVIPISRRVLESRFKNLIGHTPHDEILRVRIDRARMLLSETNLKLAQVAQRTGFPHTEYLTVVFKRKTGVPPSLYRKRTQN